MRRIHPLFAIPLFMLGAPALIHAQDEKEKEKPFVLKMKQMRVGFHAYNVNDPGQYKIGLWTPVFVRIQAGQKGLPIKARGDGFLRVESFDSEGVGTFFNEEITTLNPLEEREFVAYAKPGGLQFNSTKIDVHLHWDDRTFPAPQSLGNPITNFNSHLYLTLGTRIPDLRAALVSLARGGQFVDDFDNANTGFRTAVYETDPRNLPRLWFGYQGMDVIFLNTDKKEFLNTLSADKERLSALAKWVRRGGRLIIPINQQNQDLVYGMLNKRTAWEVPVPASILADSGDAKSNTVDRIPDIEAFAQVQNLKPFPSPGSGGINLAKLDLSKTTAGLWDVLAKVDNRAVIARTPYGMGSITCVAFSFDQSPFTKWDGRVEFLKNFVDRMAPRVDTNQQNFNKGQFFPGGKMGNFDLSTDLHRTLDNFDVSVVPFGYVALFIILYILVVGPLDYFVLKYVFNKLEWTWVTFPAVVLAVSVAAYFTAYALKGNDLKINKVDIVDFDLRSDIDQNLKPIKAHAYGNTYFTILSPRIQNYTIGIEPNAAFWGGAGEKPLDADMVTWLGRADDEGPGAMGAGRTQGFFRRPYEYAEDARGLVKVPIPVWTTKSFTASWEAPLGKAPIEANLKFYAQMTKGRDRKISGVVQNNLPVDLDDVWVIYDQHCYEIKGGLPKGKETIVSFEAGDRQALSGWSNLGREVGRDRDFKSAQGSYDPTSLIKYAFFHDRAMDVQGTGRNFTMRGLDQSWRVRDILAADAKILQAREVVLCARVRFKRGEAKALSTDAAFPLPTNLWMGSLPTEGNTRPGLLGQMAQDTFVRVFLSVRAAGNE